ncbi:hypothetical protein APX81_20660 [Escherichia coli]|nr:fels-2 prophage Pin [Escherichia coli]KQJ32307.1 hypothetical protein AM271_18560 [Escherichia coli]PAZ26585.1 hypothetical protein APU33_06240 [Escherichia coli]PAZ27938.1 hypothetical protein APU34_26025 [Escherichia coli]PAZ39817.1 hypothetical protein APU36_11575 [Escherichia coli]
MAKNDFKAFATDRNANVISQEEWEALPALLSGFTAGKASSAQVNKVIRQASFIAAALAQFVSDKTQRDVLDNGDLPGFVELLGSGFAVEYLSRKNPFGDIKSDGTVQTALENLGMTDILNDKQDKNDNLTSLSSLTGIPDGLAFFTGAGTMDMTALTQNGREILSKKNVSETLQYLTLGDGTGRLLGVQVFGSSGTYHKSPGVTKIIVEAVGGGGASGNLSATASNNCGVSAAGSNGAYAKAFFYQSIPESVQVTIGSGGVAGTGPGGSGGDGGNTSFGDLLVCPGGRGSTQVQQVPPFSGGSATEAPIPTGQGILFHSVSRSNLCGALGLGDDQAIGVESITTTMLGTYGIGGTGKYNKASSGPATGNNGNQGYILVWEYQ